jgi:hypothetical protein
MVLVWTVGMVHPEDRNAAQRGRLLLYPAARLVD